MQLATRPPPSHNKSTILIIEKFNARVGTDCAKSMPDLFGKYSLGESNKRGFRF